MVARRSLLEMLAGDRRSDTCSDVTAVVRSIAAGRAVVVAARDVPQRVPLVFGRALHRRASPLQLQLGARLQSDGFYYFAYLRSLAFDRDVDFTNDYRMLGPRRQAVSVQPDADRLRAIRLDDRAGDRLVAVLRRRRTRRGAGCTAQRRATSAPTARRIPYRQAVCIAGLFYGLLGCWFMYRLTRSFFDRAPRRAPRSPSRSAGSFMLWYIVKEPSMTHAPSMAAVAGFTWLWAATRERRTLADGRCSARSPASSR